VEPFLEIVFGETKQALKQSWGIGRAQDVLKGKESHEFLLKG